MILSRRKISPTIASKRHRAAPALERAAGARTLIDTIINGSSIAPECPVRRVDARTIDKAGRQAPSGSSGYVSVADATRLRSIWNDALVDVHVDILSADDPVLETVLHWHWREWSLGTEAERDEWRWRLRSRTGTSGIPFTLLARWGGEPVGSISVCVDDVDADFADRGPWLSGVYVLGAARDLGLGRRLLDVAARRAREAGATELWLHTGEAARFYERCGYDVARPKMSLAGDAVLWRSLS